MNKFIFIAILILIFSGLFFLYDIDIYKEPPCENSCGKQCYSNCTDELNFICAEDFGRCSYLTQEQANIFYNKTVINKGINKIYITNAVLEELNNAFLSTKNEIMYCLVGDEYKDSYIITDIYSPPINISNEHYVTTSYDCEGDIFGYIHSHPNGICAPSTENNNALNQINEGDTSYWDKLDYQLYGIICDRDKFVFYTGGNYEYNQYIDTVKVSDMLESDITLNIKDTCPIHSEACEGECYNTTIAGVHECINNKWICLNECDEICYTPCKKGVFKCENGNGICQL